MRSLHFSARVCASVRVNRRYISIIRELHWKGPRVAKDVRAFPGRPSDVRAIKRIDRRTPPSFPYPQCTSYRASPRPGWGWAPNGEAERTSLPRPHLPVPGSCDKRCCVLGAFLFGAISLPLARTESHEHCSSSQAMPCPRAIGAIILPASFYCGFHLLLQICRRHEPVNSRDGASSHRSHG
jgi:hypothetical protein